MLSNSAKLWEPCEHIIKRLCHLRPKEKRCNLLIGVWFIIWFTRHSIIWIPYRNASSHNRTWYTFNASYALLKGYCSQQQWPLQSLECRFLIVRASIRNRVNDSILDLVVFTVLDTMDTIRQCQFIECLAPMVCGPRRLHESLPLEKVRDLNVNDCWGFKVYIAAYRLAGCVGVDDYFTSSLGRAEVTRPY